MDYLLSILANVPTGWRVFFLSMIPVTELRGALPLGVYWGLDIMQSFLWAICGNFLPVIPLLLLLRWVYNRLLASGRFPRLRGKMESYHERKGKQVRRYGVLGLILLVAVPLPGTGIWTGCLVASVLGLDLLPAVIGITIGEIIAGILVSLAVCGVITAWNLGSEIIILGGIIAALLFFIFYRKKL